jgi:D-alanyl-D-alanine carboxypeptidase/D-alanyl-D-alanine-endopeptidase (penicillin-binding protein 4)
MRIPLLCLAALLVTTGAARRPAPLPVELDRTIARAKDFSSAFLGMKVVRLSDGKILYQRNENRLFIPASNTKLFTTALALKRLGPDYRFVTSIFASQPVDANGTLHGDLVLIGRGDPTLSARPYPYAKEWTDEESVPAIAQMADQLVAGGLRAIQGDVVGDDTRYPWHPYPAGWGMDDGTYEYGAPVSALVVHDNMFNLTVEAGAAEGEFAQVYVQPRFEFSSVDNMVRTVAGDENKVHIEGRPGIPEIRLWGTLGVGKRDVTPLAISDPAQFAAAVLREELTRRGVAARGNAVARHRLREDSVPPDASGIELVRRVSPPLSQLLQVVDKVSENMHAEVMLREVGAVRRNQGTGEAGLAEMRDFLTEIGIADDQYRLMDGSGMSRTTLVSPQAITKLLAFMYSSPDREQWMGLLPVGGEDGTLRKRFKGHSEASAIHAKTGSLGSVRALSGYVDSKRYGMLAFSVLLNNYLAKDAEVALFIDTIGLKLVGK